MFNFCFIIFDTTLNCLDRIPVYAVLSPSFLRQPLVERGSRLCLVLQLYKVLSCLLHHLISKTFQTVKLHEDDLATFSDAAVVQGVIRCFPF